MQLSKTELQKLQNTTLHILEVFAACCEEHRLKYYLIGGALLGAARCGKWIPWDDDIDVAMPREDYERLQCVFREHPIEGMFLQSAETDPLFSREILKLRLDGSVLKEYSTSELPIHQGIYIDIFPVDYTDSTHLALRAFRIRLLMSLRAIKSGYKAKRLPLFRKLIKAVFSFVPSTWIDRRITGLCTKDNNGMRRYAVLLLHNYCWKHQLHEADVLGDGGTCRFEGHSFRAPASPDIFLAKVFGADYLTPPVDAKPPHRYLAVTFPAEQSERKEADSE